MTKNQILEAQRLRAARLAGQMVTERVATNSFFGGSMMRAKTPWRVMPFAPNCSYNPIWNRAQKIYNKNPKVVSVDAQIDSRWEIIVKRFP